MTRTALPRCLLAAVLALASAGCKTAATRQAVRDAAVGDVRDAGHQTPPQDSGYVDAADTGSAITICTDTVGKWSALVAAHRQCDRDQDCGEIDQWQDCDCRNPVLVAVRGDASPLLTDFLDRATAQCPGLVWPPHVATRCDPSFVGNMRCAGHLCLADNMTCYDAPSNDASVSPGDGG